MTVTVLDRALVADDAGQERPDPEVPEKAAPVTMIVKVHSTAISPLAPTLMDLFYALLGVCPPQVAYLCLTSTMAT